MGLGSGPSSSWTGVGSLAGFRVGRAGAPSSSIPDTVRSRDGLSGCEFDLGLLCGFDRIITKSEGENDGTFA